MKKILLAIFVLFTVQAFSQEVDIKKSMKGFDKYMDQVLEEWKQPGAGVAIVYKDQVVYAKGFGYRDYGKKLPVTPQTQFQIASNTKLFTAIGASMLVEKGLLSWDEPLKKMVPEIEFYNDNLTNNVTLRDMLGHKTGLPRNDMMLFVSDFSRKDLFERLKYIKPINPFREGYLYSNLMYIMTGYMIEYKTGQTWEEYTAEHIFKPLEMNNTHFSIPRMLESDDFGMPYHPDKDASTLHQVDPVEVKELGPAGTIISTLEDLSHWVIALMNDGKYKDKEVIPANAIKETLNKGTALPNIELETKGYDEVLNVVYFSGRRSEAYKGHFLTKHGGDLTGYHSQVATLPQEDLGIITFVIGDQMGLVRDIIMYNVADRLLGMEQTDWHGRRLEEAKKAKETARAKEAESDKIEGTSPTHELAAYAGTFYNDTYGDFTVTYERDSLFLNLSSGSGPIFHYHYNRFDTPADEVFGSISVNFGVSAEGEVASVEMELDGTTVSFKRQADASLSDVETLKQYVGAYQLDDRKVDICLDGDHLTIVAPGRPTIELVPHKKDIFKVEAYSFLTFEFIWKDEAVFSLKQKSPHGISEFKRVQ